MSKRSQVPPLRRRRPTREPLRRFVIFCEGENTETAYFGELEAIFSNALISIETMPGAGVPYTIAEKSIAFAKKAGIIGSRRSKDYFSQNDEVWAVFDRDTHPRYSEAVNLCNSHGIGVGASNPCFELWILLHYEEFDKPSSGLEVQRRLQELDPHYDRDKSKRPDCKNIIADCDLARSRAERQLTRRIEEKEQPINPPYTTVFKLLQKIGDASKQGDRKKNVLDSPQGNT